MSKGESSTFDKHAAPPGKLGSMKIVPVPPGHEHEPGELEAMFDLAAGVVYVREEDWPLIRAELENLPTRQ